MFITTDRLDDAVLAKAVCEEVLAVQVKQFIPRETAMEIGQRILGQGFDSYVNAPDIGRIGMTLYEAENIPARLDAYFDAALDSEEGDLVLFNSRRMHAVTPGSDKPRLSLSCFVGYRGVASPLTFWS